MARVKVHSLCMRPLAECDCPDDDEQVTGHPDDGSDEDAA